VKLSGTGGLARAGKALADVWGRRIGNRFWDVLLLENASVATSPVVLR